MYSYLHQVNDSTHNRRKWHETMIFPCTMANGLYLIHIVELLPLSFKPELFL